MTLLPALLLDDRGIVQCTVITSEHSSFEECVGQTLEWCEAHIDEVVAINPDIFQGCTVRTPYVGLRVNMEETHVTGLKGDGVVSYSTP